VILLLKAVCLTDNPVQQSVPCWYSFSTQCVLLILLLNAACLTDTAVQYSVPYWYCCSILWLCNVISDALVTHWFPLVLDMCLHWHVPLLALLCCMLLLFVPLFMGGGGAVEPRWMKMSVQQSVECLTRETEVLGENLPQCRFVQHKSHMTWPGLEPGPPELQHGLNCALLLRIYNMASYSVSHTYCRALFTATAWYTDLHVPGETDGVDFFFNFGVTSLASCLGQIISSLHPV
jgi:hypothetical protein